MDFRWNDWNIDPIADHGISPEEAEYVVEASSPPYPDDIGNGKSIVVGRTAQGEYLQVIFLFDEDGTIYVIHARPLSDKEKRRFRRRMR